MNYNCLNLLLCIILIGSIGLVGCENDGPTGPEPDESVIWPLAVGNYWIYEIKEYLTGELTDTDTDTIEVVSSFIHDGNTWYLMNTDADEGCRNANDGLWFTGVGEDIDDFLLYKYPASVGDKWIIYVNMEVNDDSMEVVSGTMEVVSISERVTVPVGTFDGCYNYRTTIKLSVSNILLKPDIGCVKAYATIDFFGNVYTFSQELKSYHIQ